jgi:hypothetical protein
MTEKYVSCKLEINAPLSCASLAALKQAFSAIVRCFFMEISVALRASLFAGCAQSFRRESDA